MNWTLFEELDKKSLQAYVTNRQYPQLYYPTLFPFEFNPYMKYEILKGAVGSRVMAEIVAPGSPAPEKQRPVISKLTGDIPSIKVKRSMTEVDINKYNVLKAMASDSNQNAILDLVFGDIDFCVDALDGRLEWMGLQALSQGTMSLTASNSAGIITTDSLDFQIPSANKNVMSAADHYWTTGVYSSNDPIGDLETAQSEAASAGYTLNYALMNKTKWTAFRTSSAVQKWVAPFAIAGASLQRAPSLDQVNEALEEEGLPRIVVVGTRVKFENHNGTISTVDPWLNSDSEDRYVTLVPDIPVGRTYYGTLAEETNPPAQVIQAKRGPMLISKYSNADPLTEFTKGEVNAIPVIGDPDGVWIIDTESHTTFGA